MIMKLKEVRCIPDKQERKKSFQLNISERVGGSSKLQFFRISHLAFTWNLIAVYLHGNKNVLSKHKNIVKKLLYIKLRFFLENLRYNVFCILSKDA